MSQLAFTAQELAARLGGVLHDCPPDRSLTEVKPLEEAGAQAVSFLANPRYHRKALASEAGLILADAKAELAGRPRLVMENPYWGFAQAVGLLNLEWVATVNDIYNNPANGFVASFVGENNILYVKDEGMRAAAVPGRAE